MGAAAVGGTGRGAGGGGTGAAATAGAPSFPDPHTAHVARDRKLRNPQVQFQSVEGVDVVVVTGVGGRRVTPHPTQCTAFS